ncbi:hypothetical protein OC846_005767 [Tilletia horrida]|uniref:NAD(P)-binding domain-containing protein n=1 Tax=Tilletia horrida TaxID=155126 RepID=A0AAN6JP76_9BASI|nr:hypothetical protein OC845_005898 [Tilletia horrida]KAK0545207.1 hypothetical protein OC846_005767 [Tilletia horrida]
MSGLETFAVLGSGNLGSHIVEEFLSAKLPLTILTRDASKPALQAYVQQGARLKGVDYSSVDSIAEAFTGIDAVISALGPGHPPELPKDIIRAAKKAGVKVVVPSEFGVDYEGPEAAPVPPGIQKKADLHNFAEDWLYYPDFGWDVPNRTVIFLNDGNTPISVTDTRDVATFVRQILTTQPIPEPGSGRTYRVEGYETTQLQALAALEKGVGEKFTIKHEDYGKVAALQTEPSWAGLLAWLRAAAADGRQKLSTNDNAVVGFKARYTLEDTVREHLKTMEK